MGPVRAEKFLGRERERSSMDLAHSPLFQRLARSRRIMIAGAGGGHDLYAGLPLYLYLKPRADAVFLGNVSFSDLLPETGRRISPAVTEIDADTPGPEDYFPERVLARWLRRRGDETSIFCFQRTGAVTLARAWQAVVSKLQLDAVVLVDGGTDILMRGDEVGLGTPTEDLTSVAAVHALDLPCKLVASLGFGVDSFDGVCHAQVLEAVAQLQARGAFLGVLSLLPQHPEAKAFVEAVDDAAQAMPGSPSVVTNSIASAVESRFGNVHRTWRTEGNKLFISPLMSMYWCFELDAVARRCLYLKELQATVSYGDVDRVVETFRRQNPPMRSWEAIPY